MGSGVGGIRGRHAKWCKGRSDAEEGGIQLQVVCLSVVCQSVLISLVHISFFFLVLCLWKTVG